MTKPTALPRRARAVLRVGAALGCLAVASALAGCGRRGPPEAPDAAAPAAPPPGVTDAPLTTPSGVAPIDNASASSLRPDAAAGANGQTGKKPARNFFLDPLL
ncbi:lipoprotein [Methylocella sp.]|uniref:lipoprotein n=1 Tax=Methylocella sp. TaxID=1978226 RepID=UPI0037848E69